MVPIIPVRSHARIIGRGYRLFMDGDYAYNSSWMVGWVRAFQTYKYARGMGTLANSKKTLKNCIPAMFQVVRRKCDFRFAPIFQAHIA